MKRLLLLNLSGIECRSTSKMAAVFFTRPSINQSVSLFRYSDWLSRYRHLKLEELKISEACRANGRHGTNISKIKISQHTFVCHYS